MATAGSPKRMQPAVVVKPEANNGPDGGAEEEEESPVSREPTFPQPFVQHTKSSCLGFSTRTDVLEYNGIRVAKSDSIYGPIWQMVDYNPRCIAGGAAVIPFTVHYFTVFQEKRNAINLTIMVGIAFLVYYVTWWDDTNDARLANYSTLWMSGRNSIQILVAFVLGGYIINFLGKWQTKRGLYGKLVGRSRDAIMKTACVLTPLAEGGPVSQEEALWAHEAKETIIRYFNLAMEFAILKPRGLMDSVTVAKPFLEQRCLLRPGEWERLVPGDRHTTVYYWILCLLRHCKARHLLDEHEFVLMANTVSDCRGVANDLMDMLPNGYPFAYVHLVNLLTRVFQAFLSVESGLKMSTGRREWVVTDNGNEPPAFWWICWIVMLIGCHSCFQGLLDLQYIMHNPFLGDKHGVAHEPIVYGQIATYSGWMIDGKCEPVPLRRASTWVPRNRQGSAGRGGSDKEEATTPPGKVAEERQAAVGPVTQFC